MRRLFFRRFATTMKLESGKAFYLVDYDLKEIAVDPERKELYRELEAKRGRFYSELPKLLREFGIKRPSECKATSSVIFTENYDLATRVKDLAFKYGGSANVWKAEVIA